MTTEWLEGKFAEAMEMLKVCHELISKRDESKDESDESQTIVVRCLCVQCSYDRTWSRLETLTKCSFRTRVLMGYCRLHASDYGHRCSYDDTNSDDDNATTKAKKLTR